MTIEDARKLLQKKEEQGADKEKIDMLKPLFKDDNIFFQINMRTAFGILEFLGVGEDEIEKEYLELISPSQYLKHRVYTLKEKEDRE